MIRFIAALDSKNGIANNEGIPWKGKLPTDVAYYRGKISGHKYLIGYGTYKEHTKPIENTKTFVATSSPESLIDGFTKVENPTNFLENTNEDIWAGGGAGLFSSFINYADELYLTRIDHDFNCTKFFPKFEDKFELVNKTPVQIENGINFHFEIWKRN